MNLDHISPGDAEFLRGEIIGTTRIIRRALPRGITVQAVVESVSRNAGADLTHGDLCALLGVAYWVLANMDGTVDDES
jgi:hypothetical protein